jgi:hypothetical protein
VRSEIFRELGGFDAQKYPAPSIEDIELGIRLRRSQRGILLDKNLRVKHLKCWTLLSVLKSDIRDRAMPWAQLILQTREMPRDLNLTYRARVSVAAIMLLAGFSVVLSTSHRLPGVSPTWVVLAWLSGVLLLLALNHGVYRFFWKQRGAGFALAAIPNHWLYYFYSGLVWIYCCFVHYLRMAVLPPTPEGADVSGRDVPQIDASNVSGTRTAAQPVAVDYGGGN